MIGRLYLPMLILGRVIFPTTPDPRDLCFIPCPRNPPKHNLRLPDWQNHSMLKPWPWSCGTLIMHDEAAGRSSYQKPLGTTWGYNEGASKLTSSRQPSISVVRFCQQSHQDIQGMPGHELATPSQPSQLWEATPVLLSRQDGTLCLTWGAQVPSVRPHHHQRTSQHSRGTTSNSVLCLLPWCPNYQGHG